MSGRHEATRGELAARGVAVAVVVGLLLALAWARAGGALGGDPVVTAELADAGGALRPGSDVKVRGVVVGRVDEVEAGDAGTVRVVLRLPQDELDRVPGNVVARILPATVFGTTYVDLVARGGPAPEPLRAGATVPADASQDTLELQQALDDVDRLVTALGPAELASALGTAAEALDGRGEQLGRLVDRADAYLGRVLPLLPLVRRDVRELADALEVVDRVAPDLLQATDDGLVTLRTLVDQEDAVAALLVGGTDLARAAGVVLAQNRLPLVRFLDDVALTLDAVHDLRREGITGAVEVNRLLGARLRSARQRGFLHVDAVLRGDAPAPYGPGDRPTYRGESGTAEARP